MSYAAKDGAWISAVRIMRIDCDKCGVVSTSKWPMNEREVEEAIKKHICKVHGGPYGTH